ncbi:hypothetical protein KO481_03515 [Nocardia sp. NEAU-G5]|uniref:SAM-dependent methyltransferase n=1 Tax=Nocardia albiluteola TaxID=2842303 RepID=A0ABS6ARD2_9NOCA|nr:hypothetical protein [Nocardia albiluteola]MBU3060587.1 hypothetical protein [Nocardia albiluteola]
MTELALTAERRDELAALLGDERLLRDRYPRAAEYLNTAPMLPGTGDDAADAAFDLRFVHFMTGGRKVSENPYWDIIAPSVSVREGRRVVDGGRPNGSARLGFTETILQAAYAYAIPSPETVAWLAQLADGRSVVDLGAGRGYWAAQLAGAGIRVEAFESEPPDRTQNPSFLPAAGQDDVWHGVGDLAELETRGGIGANEMLFLCWPPGWGNPMASQALAAFTASGGERVVYIGEPKGGKTGDDAFFDALTADWTLKSEDVQFVSWWNLADRAQGWVRR